MACFGVLKQDQRLLGDQYKKPHGFDAERLFSAGGATVSNMEGQSVCISLRPEYIFGLVLI